MVYDQAHAAYDQAHGAAFAINLFVSVASMAFDRKIDPLLMEWFYNHGMEWNGKPYGID
jgi:hypothetical protein